MHWSVKHWLQSLADHFFNQSCLTTQSHNSNHQIFLCQFWYKTKQQSFKSMTLRTSQHSYLENTTLQWSVAKMYRHWFWHQTAHCCPLALFRVSEALSPACKRGERIRWDTLIICKERKKLLCLKIHINTSARILSNAPFNLSIYLFHFFIETLKNIKYICHNGSARMFIHRILQINFVNVFFLSPHSSQ